MLSRLAELRESERAVSAEMLLLPGPGQVAVVKVRSLPLPVPPLFWPTAR